ncbi:type I restriction enzyme HsdR N-terminal domain-containing protein [bacterium]|nr:type I restriction enzyme HsdR N-terminal domain-containing protein [bacterium]
MSNKKDLPEERIRRALLSFMKEELCYPEEMIAVERSLSSFPHLKGKKVPNRRFDVAVFGGKEVKPLLIIECKAVPLDQKAFDQVIGYNHLVQAPFLALCNGEEILTLIKEANGYRIEKGLPEYKALFG